MRVLMRSAAASLLIAAGFFFVPGASAQLQSPSPGLSQQPQNIPDQKLDAAAAAIERVASLKQDYQQRVAAAAPLEWSRRDGRHLCALGTSKAWIDHTGDWRCRSRGTI
jgi:hypothetical protein